FKRAGATEQARELIGTIQCGDNEDAMRFPTDDLRQRVRKLWADAFGKEAALEPREKYTTRDRCVDVGRLINEVCGRQPWR
ncbi:hypothetical protein C8Q72DRAFT_778545, partial [Fomitopsis betulina]